MFIFIFNIFLLFCLIFHIKYFIV
ncbi:hypothetical protein PFUGPA_03452 [Plasmodium falciparum Palo Alto/Uganda]|uniref:Uncharacterized protein n=1 Tax=Plasmodium falciparum (isolate Palo Alto / Uganda) TaxID=57270 RepID=W4IXZ7_PLAFP|nr:hypothetical protein PFUGPA_03452 [Plasmodium falciparum Palo Alto/Uganda]